MRLYRESDNLRVDVLDNGPGIEPAEQKLIFEKFRQMGDTMTASRRAPVSDCRSAGRSSSISAAASGWRVPPARVRLFRSRCP